MPLDPIERQALSDEALAIKALCDEASASLLNNEELLRTNVKIKRVENAAKALVAHWNRDYKDEEGAPD